MLVFYKPDLAYVVGNVCQYMHAPRLSHWQVVKCILLYLKQTSQVGLQISHSSRFNCKPFLMPIGTDIQIIAAQQVIFLYSWVITSYFGL